MGAAKRLTQDLAEILCEQLICSNHKGQFCWVQPIFCQEGICLGCEIYRRRKEGWVKEV